MKRKTPLVLMSLFTLLGAKSVTMLNGCTPTPAEDDHLGSAEQALTASQCNYFAVNGEVQICHRTGSAKNPYQVLKISEQACINAHALHAGDYVAANDPTCQGGGCMPENAPCDATLPCCDGFHCQSGTCVANVSDHCAPSPCQNGSTCASDAGGYTCTCLPGYTGTNCETEIDACASNPCVNGTCLDGVDFYECACAPGWTGTDCDIDSNGRDPDPCVHGLCDNGINGDYTCYCDLGYEGQNCEVDHDDCNPNPCQNGGTCVDGVNSYTCQCPAGYSGTHCETQATACPCSSLPEWQAALATSPLPAGSCSASSWPGPCGSVANVEPGSSFAYLNAGDGSAAWTLYSGSPNGGSSAICGIYDILTNTYCSFYGHLEISLPVTPAEASACQAEILSWAQQNGATCH